MAASITFHLLRCVYVATSHDRSVGMNAHKYVRSSMQDHQVLQWGVTVAMGANHTTRPDERIGPCGSMWALAH